MGTYKATCWNIFFKQKNRINIDKIYVPSQFPCRRRPVCIFYQLLILSRGYSRRKNATKNTPPPFPPWISLLISLLSPPPPLPQSSALIWYPSFALPLPVPAPKNVTFEPLKGFCIPKNQVSG